MKVVLSGYWSNHFQSVWQFNTKHIWEKFAWLLEREGESCSDLPQIKCTGAVFDQYKMQETIWKVCISNQTIGCSFISAGYYSSTHTLEVPFGLQPSWFFRGWCQTGYSCWCWNRFIVTNTAPGTTSPSIWFFAHTTPGFYPLNPMTCLCGGCFFWINSQIRHFCLIRPERSRINRTFYMLEEKLECIWFTFIRTIK